MNSLGVHIVIMEVTSMHRYTTSRKLMTTVSMAEARKVHTKLNMLANRKVGITAFPWLTWLTSRELTR